MSNTEAPHVDATTARPPVLRSFAFRLWTKVQRMTSKAIEARIEAAVGRDLAKRTAGRLHYQSWRTLPADYTERWGTKPGAAHRLTIVIVTYRQPEPLRCLLSSLRCQTLQNFDVLVLHDGPDEETRKVVDEHAALTPAACRYIQSTIRHNDYGHSLRAIGLAEARGEFVLITNGDNYYSPRFTEFAFEALDLGSLDLVLWDIVHSHYSVSSHWASCLPFDCYPMRFKIDIGAFLVRTAVAQQIGFSSRAHAADADYLEDLLFRSTGPLRLGKVAKTLMVHN